MININHQELKRQVKAWSKIVKESQPYSRLIKARRLQGRVDLPVRPPEEKTTRHTLMAYFTQRSKRPRVDYRSTAREHKNPWTVQASTSRNDSVTRVDSIRSNVWGRRPPVRWSLDSRLESSKVRVNPHVRTSEANSQPRDRSVRPSLPGPHEVSTHYKRWQSQIWNLTSSKIKMLKNTLSSNNHPKALDEAIYTVEDLEIKSITIINQLITFSAFESYLPIEGVL